MPLHPVLAFDVCTWPSLQLKYPVACTSQLCEKNSVFFSLPVMEVPNDVSLRLEVLFCSTTKQLCSESLLLPFLQT